MCLNLLGDSKPSRVDSKTLPSRSECGLVWKQGLLRSSSEDEVIIVDPNPVELEFLEKGENETGCSGSCLYSQHWEVGAKAGGLL